MRPSPLRPLLPLLAHGGPWTPTHLERRLATCPNSCDLIPEDSVEFCQAEIKYTVCRTKSSWQAVDLQFPTSLADLGVDVEALLAAASDAQDPSHECASKLVDLQCKVLYPACEIGVETRSLCKSACEQVVSACKGDQRFELDEGMCANDAQFSSDQTCIFLSYEGANKILWIAGFSIGLIFSFLAALGLNLQKMSMNREALKPEELRRPHMKQPM
jgi:hypothetical protein